MHFTVAIAAYKEEKTLPKTIPLMLEQLGSNELIIAACGDETIKVAKSFKDQRIKVIPEYKREGKAAALTKIFKKAKHNILILTDADVIPEKGSFELLARHFKNPKVGCVSGRVVALNADKSIFTFFAHFAYDSMHELRMAGHRLPTGYLFAIRKGVINEVPKCYSEDALIGAMINRAGYEFVYEPESVVRVLYPTTLKDFFIQKVRTRYGHLEVKNRYNLDFSEFRPKGQIRKIIKKYPLRQKPLIASYMVIEAAAWLKAWMDFKRGKGSWKTVQSSKI